MSTEPRARPGARYRCFGDGLCCSDIHAIGPLRRKEQRMLRAFSPDLVVEHEGDAVLGMSAEGRCVFWTDAGCALHARLGPKTKPGVCSQFPFGLVETPGGDRIITSHRCPCRTLGARPPIDLAEARAALGRVKRSSRSARARGSWPFPDYEHVEGELIRELLGAEDPRSVLPDARFPQLADGSWADLGEVFGSAAGEGGFGAALAWFGQGIREIHRASAPGKLSPDPPRPWVWSFARAEARLTDEEPAAAILGDWAADEIWGLDWITDLSFEQAQVELACLLELGFAIARRIGTHGVRADVAHAEAAMVLDLATGSEIWKGIRRSFAT